MRKILRITRVTSFVTHTYASVSCCYFILVGVLGSTSTHNTRWTNCLGERTKETQKKMKRHVEESCVNDVHSSTPCLRAQRYLLTTSSSGASLCWRAVRVMYTDTKRGIQPRSRREKSTRSSSHDDFTKHKCAKHEKRPTALQPTHTATTAVHMIVATRPKSTSQFPLTRPLSGPWAVSVRHTFSCFCCYESFVLLSWGRLLTLEPQAVTSTRIRSSASPDTANWTRLGP